jgi:hypothetical protein
MKVKFQYGLAGYTGKADGLVFCYNRRLGRVYARKNVPPKLVENHHQRGSITANLHSLQPSIGFKNDLRLYLLRYNGLPENADKTMYSWVNIYLKMMYQMAKLYPETDLEHLTRDYIYTNNLPCSSVKRAVEAGLLPKVRDWEQLDQTL